MDLVRLSTHTIVSKQPAPVGPQSIDSSACNGRPEQWIRSGTCKAFFACRHLQGKCTMDYDKVEFRFHFPERQGEEENPIGAELVTNNGKGSVSSPNAMKPIEGRYEGNGTGKEVYVRKKSTSEHTEVIRVGHLSIHKCLAITQGQTDTSDLIPGIYEGGRKLWECSVDLARFMTESQEISNHLKGAKVLELGCGHGLPGICALLLGATSADFQDYNEDVIHDVTSMNVNTNLLGTDKRSTRYFCGDWEMLIPVFESGAKYNIILSAETIYSPTNQRKLCALIESCLCPKNGIALVAAKSYYFGVGGGTRQFEALVLERGKLDSKVARVLDSGAANKREILQLNCKAQ